MSSNKSNHKAVYFFAQKIVEDIYCFNETETLQQAKLIYSKHNE